MYCGDTETIEKRVIPPTDPACIPELVYSANDGLPTGLSMVGFHSSKYAPHESDKITRRRYEQTDTDVNISERTRNDNQDLIKQTEAVTTRSLEATTKLLKERLADTNFWKTELEREIKDIIKATDKLELDILNKGVELYKKAIQQCENQIKSEHERMATEELWTVLSNLIIDVTTDITQQKDTVNSAFQNNLSYLESQLADYKKRLKEVR
ncbi:unnamed protein product [Trichobilharzia regenti]|nr:unnamed protein product [Trichobilharzia regenti]